jgi:hypothetical protein
MEGPRARIHFKYIARVAQTASALFELHREAGQPAGEVFLVFPPLLQANVEAALRLAQDCFLAHTFQFIKHQSS